MEPTTIETNRKPIEEMTDREMLMEILALLRGGEAAIKTAMENPMLRAMMPF